MVQVDPTMLVVDFGTGEVVVANGWSAGGVSDDNRM